MKTFILFAIFYIGLQIAQSLPTNTEVTHDDHTETSSKLSDPNSPLRQKLKSYMATLDTSFQTIIHRTLTQLNNTEAYEDSRQKLNTFLSSIQKYHAEPLVNCVWNIVDLGRDFNVLKKSFTNPEATAEDKETLDLLLGNGIEDVDRQLREYWWSFIQRELGDDINEDYC